MYLKDINVSHDYANYNSIEDIQLYRFPKQRYTRLDEAEGVWDNPTINVEQIRYQATVKLEIIASNNDEIIMIRELLGKKIKVSEDGKEVEGVAKREIVNAIGLLQLEE